MYTTLIGIGAMAGAVGWYVVRSRVSAAEAERSRIDAKSKKRFSRRPVADDAEVAVAERPRKRDFGRR